MDMTPAQADADADALAKAARKRWKTNSLFGGNCGMFDMAMADLLVDAGYEPELVFYTLCGQCSTQSRA